MPNCAICNKHVSTGLVVHKECFDEISKLLKAKAEGRLHIAPLKDGTPIYRIGWGEPFYEIDGLEIFQDSYVFNYTERVIGKPGENYYLTREDAEAEVMKLETGLSYEDQ